MNGTYLEPAILGVLLGFVFYYLKPIFWTLFWFVAFMVFCIWLGGDEEESEDSA